MKTDQQYKNIPNEWQQVKLGDISNIKMGQSPLSSAYNEIKKGLPLIQGNNDIKNKKTIGNIWTNEITKTAEKGELILTVRAPVGAIGIAHDKICIGRGVCAIESKYKPFLWHFLNYFEHKWNTLEQGSTFTAVNSSDIKKIKILLPPLPEQNRIVSVLETWDKAIENLNNKIEIKKQIKKGLMQDLLTGKKRLSGFKDKWEIQTIGDVFYLKKGSELSKENLNVLGKSECILYGELYTTYNEVIDKVKSKTNVDEGTLSKYGDILIPASTTTGAIDLAIASSLNKDNVLLGGDINILRSKNKIDSRFFAYYLTHAKKHNLARLAQGVTIVHLYSSDFKKVRIEIPAVKEQSAIADIITTSEKEIVKLEKKLSIVKEQKKYLLNNLITGAIRTPEDLLEKVK